MGFLGRFPVLRGALSGLTITLAAVIAVTLVFVPLAFIDAVGSVWGAGATDLGTAVVVLGAIAVLVSAWGVARGGRIAAAGSPDAPLLAGAAAGALVPCACGLAFAVATGAVDDAAIWPVGLALATTPAGALVGLVGALWHRRRSAAEQPHADDRREDADPHR